ncbi:MAG: peptidoglycan-binding protein [Patescibacteria group bacterium]|nr:peptidoglycan-binding protein [Patescibacteria group bacterium]
MIIIASIPSGAYAQAFALSENGDEGLPTEQASISVSVEQIIGSSENDEGISLDIPVFLLEQSVASENGNDGIAEVADNSVIEVINVVSENGNDALLDVSITSGSSENGDLDSVAVSTNPSQESVASGVSENTESVSVSSPSNTGVADVIGFSENANEDSVSGTDSDNAVLADPISSNGEDTISVSILPATGFSENGEEILFSPNTDETLVVEDTSSNGEDAIVFSVVTIAAGSSANGDDEEVIVSGVAPSGFSENGEESELSSFHEVVAVSENGDDDVTVVDTTPIHGGSDNGDDAVVSAVEVAVGVSENGNDDNATFAEEPVAQSGNGDDAAVSQVLTVLAGSSENGDDAIVSVLLEAATGSSENGGESLIAISDGNSENGDDGVTVVDTTPVHGGSDNGDDAVVVVIPPPLNGGGGTGGVIATSTPPIVVATSTPPIVIATSTPPIVVATSTPPIVVATSTPPVTDDDGSLTPQSVIHGPSVNVGYGGTINWTEGNSPRLATVSGGVTSYLTGSGLCTSPFKTYMRIGEDNDPFEVMKLQNFLQRYDGATNLQVNGTFDQATFDAVSVFQERYADDILEPWGTKAPTGYVYITTLHKMNEIICSVSKAFTADELAIFDAYKDSRNGSEDISSVVGSASPSEESPLVGETSVSATSTEPSLPTVIEVGQAPQENVRSTFIAYVAATSFGTVADFFSWGVRSTAMVLEKTSRVFEFSFQQVADFFQTLRERFKSSAPQSILDVNKPSLLRGADLFLSEVWRVICNV